ncbi:MAG TPA: YaaR family protein [Peptococcaceae bacterium]|nr:YaaR family protein [Peptococcaceae bacterium]HPZ71013.1 YaaR family protein [Peptococcaceae bacterium]HQD53883.1 YaaR family protein [Peptococcaceae bacterium]
MRIQNKDIKQNLASTTGRIEKKERVTGIRQRTFQDALQEENLANWQEQLDALLKKLDDVGKRLVKNFSVQDLIEYRETLKRFLEDTLKKAFGLQEETSFSRRGKPKIYQHIELINQDLEELSKLVLQQQKDPLKVLEKLDSIRGLLVDLYY